MKRSSLLLALLALAPGLDAQQLPLFTDGTAFGGSRLFSEGLNPLGNPARFLPRPDGIAQGTYATYVSGGMEAQDFRKALDRMQDAPEDAFLRMKTAGWGLQTTAYGLAFLDSAGHFSLTRETTTSLLPTVDDAAAHLGTGWGANTSTLEARRTQVDRMVYGLASGERGTVMGASLRVERWSLGQRVHAPHPILGQVPLPATDFYGFNQTYDHTTATSLDAGFTTEFGPGLRLGMQVDRLLGKKIYDVDEKPQARAGLQVDLGSSTRLSLEGDLNKAARMPYPVEQKTLAASLFFQVNPTVSFTLGSERRQIGEATTTRTGVTVKVHSTGFVLGAGFQIGADQPLRGGLLRLY